MEWAFSVEKRQNGERNSQKALLDPLPLQWGLFLRGDGTDHFRSSGTNGKLLRGVIGLGSYPISTPNINTVFDDVISLRGNCRNNALPRSPWEKLQLAACEKPFLTKGRNNLLLCHAIHIVFGGGAERGTGGK